LGAGPVDLGRTRARLQHAKDEERYVGLRAGRFAHEPALPIDVTSDLDSDIAVRRKVRWK